MEFTQRYRSKMVVRAIAPFIENNSNILDIGCGNGVVSSEIMKFFPTCNFTGTDILDYSVKKINFKKMPKEDSLDFPDKQFDKGLFIEVLHHIPFETQVKLIKDSLRVCSEVLILEEKPTLLGQALDHVLNYIHNPEMPILLTHRTKSEWKKLFNDHHHDFEYYDVRKPFFLLPFGFYLFRLKKT